jgi:hypothetical protein
MPLRLIQLILGRFRWDRETAYAPAKIPREDVYPVLRTEDGVYDFKVAMLIRADDSDEVSIEAITGQRLTIEVDSDGLAEIHLFAGDEDDEDRSAVGSWIVDHHQPCRAFCDISVSAVYKIFLSNQEDRELRARLRVACEANCNAAPRKGPMSEHGLRTSAAAGADGFGDGQHENSDGNGKQGELILPEDDAEPSGVFIPSQQAYTQAKHGDSARHQPDDDVEPPV